MQTHATISQAFSDREADFGELSKDVVEVFSVMGNSINTSPISLLEKSVEKKVDTLKLGSKVSTSGGEGVATKIRVVANIPRRQCVGHVHSLTD